LGGFKKVAKYLYIMRWIGIVLFALVTSLLLLTQCNNESEKSPYRNIDNPAASYVGMETCRSCHWQVYESFIKTGMGQSWDIASRKKSAADFDPHKALVYDQHKDLYYKPFWENDSLYILEFRLSGNDTIHRRLEKVSYIVGSGQHTNSHIIDINGYLFQAPITYYTQKGKWDLAPGFENGQNSRFDRKIELECMSCHNGYPDFVEESLNQYQTVQRGIDCERCHGPGSIHVSEKKSGQIIDTSKGPDYSIVNPKRLSTEAQNNLCQRCHLQGVAVLNDGKSFFDFMPSQKLSNSMHVFMPQYSGSENHMIMASHVERMKMSACYLNSGKMSCITCHNPHVSVKETPNSQYLNACKNCHASKDCMAPVAERNANEDNCVKCHMPKNGSIDIPHVAVTDHYIRRKPNTDKELKETVKFIAMRCYNSDKVDERTRARSFMEFHERYEPAKIFLDSAKKYLLSAEVKQTEADWIRLLFLQKSFNEIIQLSDLPLAENIQDAWTAYRIGEAYLSLQNFAQAIQYLSRACDLKPKALDFQSKLSTAYGLSGNQNMSEKVSLFILSQHPRYAMALFNLGVIALQRQNLQSAEKYLFQAMQANPDHVQTLVNYAVVLYQQNRKSEINQLLLRALKLDPDNQQIQMMLKDLGQSTTKPF